MSKSLKQIDWLPIVQQLETIARSGITYCKNDYDLERYHEIHALSKKILNEFVGNAFEEIEDIFNGQVGYATPKVDVRGVVFEGDKILLVQERSDEKWCLPGGWAEVGLTPFQNVEKEVVEEAGLKVKASQLIAVHDKHKHVEVKDYFHIYKLFIHCEYIEGIATPGMETLGARFFGLDELPPLSTQRTTVNQLEQMFDFRSSPQTPAWCD